MVPRKLISVGPSCISASLIKSAGLKSESYPLDWAQSGSEVIRDLFFLEPEAFYWRHVYMPVVPLKVIRDTRLLSDGELPTHQLRKVNPLFGYDWFFNPHADVNGHNKNYYLRAINRFKHMIADRNKRITLLMSDQPDMQGYNWLDVDPSLLISFLEELSSSCKANLDVLIVRLRRTQACLAYSCTEMILTGRIECLVIHIPAALYGGGASADATNYELLLAANILHRHIQSQL